MIELTDFFRKYSDMIAEAELGELSNSSEPTINPAADPVSELASYIANEVEIGQGNEKDLGDAIQKWLTDNGYDITTSGGLENKEGQV